MTHEFTVVDRGQVWFKQLQDSLAERLQKLREQNDKKSDPIETAYLRGQIAETKALLADMKEHEPPKRPKSRNPYQ